MQLSMEEFKVDFIGVGAQKAGSTWIADNLRAHPEICFSEPKEARFFISYPESSAKGSNKSTNYERFGISGYKEYFKHEKVTHKIKGEFSVGYLFDPETPQRIQKHFPDVKIIISLRHPVDRAYSQYKMDRYQEGVEKRPFKETFENNSDYLERGLYYKQLTRYLQFFPKNNFFFITMDEIKEKPAFVLRSLYQFLGVNDDFVSPYQNQKSNAGGVSRSIIIHTIASHLPAFMSKIGLFPLLNLLRKWRINRILLQLNSSSNKVIPKLSPEDRSFLYQHFIEDIAKLEVLIHKDFSHWKEE